MSKQKQLAFRKKKKDRFSVLLLLAIAALFMGMMTYKGISLYNEKQSLQKDIDNETKKIAAQEKRREELKEFEIYTHTKKYAEEVAKDKLGYVYEDEIVFKPGND